MERIKIRDDCPSLIATQPTKVNIRNTFFDKNLTLQFKLAENIKGKPCGKGK